MTINRQTPSQTIGPFYHHALLHPLDGSPGHGGISAMDPQQVAGMPIEVWGRILDAAGDPVTDAMVELWQADGAGRYRHQRDPRAADVPEGFVGFGRVPTDADGAWRVRTAMPGTVHGPDGRTQAPHLGVHIFARGLLDRVSTRIYLPGSDSSVIEADPVLSAVPADRRATLVATADGSVDDVSAFRHDIVLQGRDETVFFDV